MHKKFEILNGVISLSEKDDTPIDFYINPDEKEKHRILKNLNFDEHTLLSSLDADEISRVEFEKDYTFIVWKRPNNYSFEKELRFQVSSIGIILAKEKLTVIISDDYELYKNSQFNKVSSIVDYFLRILYYTIHHYVDHIKAINMMSKEIQNKINKSFENKYFIQMFSLSESLVYYINAISSNSIVLTKLQSNASKIGFLPEQLAIIDDLIIENNQCYKQAEIYSTILSGLMDARGSIVNNNMNTLLKNLTIINIVFLPLNLIASIGGMSEFSAITKNIPWQISYPLFCAGLIMIGWFTAIILNKVYNRNK